MLDISANLKTIENMHLKEAFTKRGFFVQFL